MMAPIYATPRPAPAGQVGQLFDPEDMISASMAQYQPPPQEAQEGEPEREPPFQQASTVLDDQPAANNPHLPPPAGSAGLMPAQGVSSGNALDDMDAKRMQLQRMLGLMQR